MGKIKIVVDLYISHIAELEDIAFQGTLENCGNSFEDALERAIEEFIDKYK